MSRVRQRRAADFRAQHEKLRATRRQVGAAFEAEPFDAKALETALAELRAQTAESQRMLHESLIEVAPSLTPEQRARLAHRALERGPGRHGKPDALNQPRGLHAEHGTYVGPGMRVRRLPTRRP